MDHTEFKKKEIAYIPDFKRRPKIFGKIKTVCSATTIHFSLITILSDVK